MVEERDKRIDGEYDPPLPKRSNPPSKEIIEKAEKLLQKYPDLKEKYSIKIAREIHQKTLEKYGIKTFKVRYISDIPSIFFEKGKIYEAFMPRDSSRFYGFFLEDMDEPGEYALPADRFERVEDDS